MSILGIVHTTISIAAIIVSLVSLIKDGYILPLSKTGKIYSVLNAGACITSFWLSKSGHFNPGHAIGILVLLCLTTAYLLANKTTAWLQYLTVFCMSFSLFLSLVPAVNETLSRLPIGHPIANGPDSFIVQSTIKLLLLLFVIGVVLQIRKVRRRGEGS
ncbi:MAG: hypothetical protein RJA07_2574 [Bacteroidota bacterium]|jgi:hypothetical protein